MAILDLRTFRRATYNGVAFSYQNSNVKGARKTVTHEYPNADVRVIEDLGKYLKAFKISAIIDNNQIGNKDELLTELDKEGPGELVHPLYGNKQVVVKEYNARDSIQQLGAVFIDIEFEEASEPVFPLGSFANLGSFVSQAQAAHQLIGEALFKINKVKAVFDSAVSKVQRAADLLDTLSRTITNSGESVTSLSNALISLKENTNSLINSPEVLFNTLSISANNLARAYNEDIGGEVDESTRTLALNSLSSIGDSDENVVGTSPNLVQRITNQTLINNQLLISSLGLGYQYASERVYLSLDELNTERERLEVQYQNFAFTLLDPVFDIITNVRYLANLNFDNLALRLERINTISTAPISLNVLTYSLYGSLANKDLVRGINSFLDPSNIEGDVRTLTDV